MKYILPHEQLHVYAKALAFAKWAVVRVDVWPERVAVRGQLDRAMESMITNLACAARQQRTDQGIYLLECSLGSVLECAACLDVAQRRQLIDATEVREGKLILQEVARMEVGLHSAWSEPVCVREEDAEYDAGAKVYFKHESLEVYQRTLQLHEGLGEILLGDKREHRYAKRMDELSTSVTLNIAEGNGRFSKRDHGSFAVLAEEAATKLAAYLDLVAAIWGMDVDPIKSLLREIMAMLAGLKEYLKSQLGGL
jgi:four helix bundle protein